jgi:hypothetical protein
MGLRPTLTPLMSFAPLACDCLRRTMPYGLACIIRRCSLSSSRVKRPLSLLRVNHSVPASVSGTDLCNTVYMGYLNLFRHWRVNLNVTQREEFVSLMSGKCTKEWPLQHSECVAPRLNSLFSQGPCDFTSQKPNFIVD